MALHTMRSQFLFALLAICSFPVAAADDFDSLLRQGRDAYNKADLDTASELFNKACGPEVNSPAREGFCQHEFGTVSSARGRENEAARYYLKALESWKLAGAPYMTSWCVTLMNLGDLYRRQHRLPRSRANTLAGHRTGAAI